MTKHQIAIAILVFVALLLYTGGSYVVVTHKLVRPTLFPTPTPTPPQPEPTRIEITNSPFSRISKPEVEALAAAGGIKEITLVYDPPPQETRDRIMEEASKAGEAVPSFLQGPVNTGALAGYFKEVTGTTLILTQKDGKEHVLGITDTTRLWIKTGDKLEIVSTFLSKLTDSTPYLFPNQLMLGVNLYEEAQTTQAQTIILFP